MKKTAFSAGLHLLLLCALLSATGCTKQAKAKRHLGRGEKYFTDEQYHKAEIEYLNVLKLVATNSLAFRRLGEISFADEQLLRAAAFLKKSVELDPGDLIAHAKLSRIYVIGGSPKESREEAELVLQKLPDNEDALLSLVDWANKPEDIKAVRQRIAALRQQAGDKAIFHVCNGYLAMREKDFKTAETELKAAVEADPKMSTAHWALSSFYISRTNMALAEPAMKAAAELSPIRSARRLRVIALKVQARDLDGARAALDDITAKAPDYLPAWIYSARLALDQKDLPRCGADLERVLSRAPDHYEALSMRSEMFIAQGKPDKALSDLDRLVSRYPRSAPARYQLALAALVAKDTPRAMAALGQTVSLDKTHTAAILLLAELNVRKGETLQAITELNELLKREPKNMRANSLLGAAYQTSGKYDEALAVYQRIAQMSPTDIDAPLKIGTVLRQQGKRDQARQVFENILKARPNDPSANSQLNDMDVAAKNYDAAISRVQKWMERTPNDAEPIFQMARIRYAQDDLKAAQPLLEKVIEMNKDAIPAYQMLARIYYKTKQVDAAIEKSRLALAQNSRDVVSQLMIAIIYDDKGDYPKAREEFEKLLAFAPDNYVALNNLAYIYADRLGDLDKAYPLARRAEELRPNDPYITDTFGWILSRRGEYGLALGLLREASQARPTDADSLSHLAITYYYSGDEPAAQDALERALKLAPAFASRAEAETCLSFLKINPATADAAAIAALEKRLAEKPADPVALSRLGVIYTKAGSVDKLMAIYEKALAANPKLAAANARLAELSEPKNPAKAVELAKNARKLAPESADIAHVAGRIAIKSSDLNDQRWGLTLLQEAAQKLNQNPNVLYDLGWAHYTQGDVGAAEKSMTAAQAGAAGQPVAAQAKRFLEFLPLADPARAAQQQAQIDQALQAEPNYLPALVARAAAAQQKGDAPAALKTLDQIITQYPGFAPAVRSYALLATAQPADPKSLNVANRARDLFQDDPEVAKALGIILYQRNDHQKAVRLLAESARKRPTDAALQYYLGMSHYQLKQNAESKAALTNALRLQANASFATEAKRVLAELK